MQKRFMFVIVLNLGIFFNVLGQDIGYVFEQNIAYRSDSLNVSDPYIGSRCVLDLYYPKDTVDFPLVVWFHGGGLKGGNKYIPSFLKRKGIAVVAVNYRLNPTVKAPVYIEDAAAAVAWVFKNIESYGGRSDLVFVSGHSAGGYLAAMIGLDKKYLAAHGVDADQIAGLIPFSGNVINHLTVRAEQGIPITQPTIDAMAPLYHVRPDAPPILLITGDREKELVGRYEENAYFWRMMQVVGHPDTRIFELDGYGHGMVEPATPLLLDMVKEYSISILTASKK
jgi:acetyl esterase/lipase